MTILVLAQNTLIRTKTCSEVSSFFELLSGVFKNSSATWLLATLLIVFLASYLGALYASIGISFSIQDQEKLIQDAEKDLLTVEVELQAKKSSLAKEKNSILESMEKVSNIRYILPKNYVVSDSALLKSQ